MIFAFASYEVDTERRFVTRERRGIRLSPQSYRLLLYLLERAGQTVTKAELRDALWDGRPDSEHRLRQEMSLLRRALGLRSRNDVIATVAGSGYRLAAPATLHTRGASSQLVHPEALRLYAEGTARMRQQDSDGFAAAFRSFEAAARVDSNFAAAYLGMARTQLRMGTNLFANVASTIPDVESHIAEAVRIDPAYIDAELLRLEVAMLTGRDVAGSVARLAKLTESNPGNAGLHHALGWAKLLELDSAGAVQEIIKALACDPTNLQMHCAVAAACFYDGNFAQAYDELELVARLEPWRSATRGSLGTALIFLGRPDEALRLLRAPDLASNQSAQAALCSALANVGDRSAARRVFTDLTSARQRFQSGYCHARCLVALGETQAALSVLDDAQGELQLKLLALDPWFRSLRNDAEFQRITRKHSSAAQAFFSR